MHSRKQVHQVAVQFSKQIFSFQAVIGCSTNSCQPNSSSCTNDDNDAYKDPYHDGQQQLKLRDSCDPAFIQACHALALMSSLHLSLHQLLHLYATGQMSRAG